MRVECSVFSVNVPNVLYFMRKIASWMGKKKICAVDFSHISTAVHVMIRNHAHIAESNQKSQPFYKNFLQMKLRMNKHRLWCL